MANKSSSEVSFYLLSSHAEKERYLFACKLIEKIYRSGVFGYIQTGTDEQSRMLDDLLWTFRPGSFIPHEIYEEKLPVYAGSFLIGTHPSPKNWQNTLINFTDHCPEDFSSATRIIEILDANESIKEIGRQRYRLYQQAGLAISTHSI
jgi:DNA polymerase-3 subunit chi